MIMLRRPFTVYDVDVIGVAAMVGLLVVTYCGMVTPTLEQAGAYQDLANSARQLESGIEVADARLEKATNELSRLRASVTERIASAPTTAAPAKFLNDAGEMAGKFGVHMIQVLPSPTRRVDGRVACDVQIVARGTSLGFVRFLDELHRVHPYFSTTDLTVRQDPDPIAGGVQINWTVQLHALDDDPSNQRRAAP